MSARTLSFTAIAIALSVPVQAADVLWKQQSSGFWTTAGNWAGNVVPTSTSQVYIGYNYPGYTFTNPSSIKVTAHISTAASLQSKASLAFLNTSSILTLAGTSQVDNAFDMTNGSIAGAGTLTVTGPVVFTNTKLLSGGDLNIGGTLSIAGASTMIDRNVTASGTTTWSATGAPSISGSGTFKNQGNFLVASSNQTWGTQFINEGTLQRTSSGAVGFSSLTNTGSVDLQSGTTTLAGNAFVNSGMIDVDNGAVLNVNSTTGNNLGGTIAVDGGQAVIGGSWTTSNLGSYNATNGGTIVFKGFLNNAGSTFSMPGTGFTGLAGATISGGNIQNSELLGTNSSVGLVNVALDHGLNIGSGSAFISGTTTLGVQNIDLAGGTVTFDNESVVYNGAITAQTRPAGLVNKSKVNAPNVDPFGGGSFIFGSTAVLQTQVDADSAVALTITSPLIESYGEITANQNGRVTVGSGEFYNYGTVEANSNGRVDLSATAIVKNNGTIRSIGGSSIVSFATDSVQNNGTIVLDGGKMDFSSVSSLDNRGQIQVKSGSTLELQNSLFGGFTNTGTIRAETAGSVWLDANQGLNTGGTVTADGVGSTIYATGSTNLATLSKAVLTNGSSLYAAGMVNDSGHAFDLNAFGAEGNFGLRDGNLNATSLVNSDRLLADSTGTLNVASLDKGLRLVDGNISTGSIDLGNGNLDLTDSVFASSGTVDVHGDVIANGQIAVSALNVDGGTVSGTGLIDGDLNLLGATLAPGNSPGDLSAQTVNFDSDSIFELEIGGSPSGNLFDRLLSQNVALDGTLKLNLIGGYTPTMGQEWQFIGASSLWGGLNLGGTFATLQLPSGWSYRQDSFGGYVSFAVVPEPASFVAVGLGGLALLRRRRRA